jgi:hypothetical protein
MERSKLAAVIALWFVFVSAIAQLFFILHYSTNVIFADQLNYVLLLDHWDWQLLFSDFNGHRLVLPRLLFVALARLTHCDVRWEIFLNWVLLQCCVVLLFLILKKSVEKRWHWITGLSLVYFLVPQYVDDLLWGMQNCVQMNQLAVIAAVYLMTIRPRSWKLDAGFILLLIIATFSFANGLVVWVVLFPLFMMSGSEDARYQPEFLRWQRPRAAWFFTTACVVLTAYFWNFQNYPRLTGFWQAPLELFLYFFAYLGSGIIVLGGYHYLPLAFYVFVGMLLCAIFAAGLFCGKFNIKKNLAPISLALFILGTAAMTALGRAYIFSAEGAFIPRYMITNMLFPVLLVNLAAQARGVKRRLSLVAIILAVILALEIIPGWLVSISSGVTWKAMQKEHVLTLRSYRAVSDEKLYEYYRCVPDLRAKLEILEKIKYNIFR